MAASLRTSGGSMRSEDDEDERATAPRRKLQVVLVLLTPHAPHRARPEVDGWEVVTARRLAAWRARRAASSIFWRTVKSVCVCV